MSRVLTRVVLVGVVLSVTGALASAQQQTTTSETKKFEVISVQGNDLVVRLPEGTRELTVPEDFRFTVDGQQLSVHELKAGMKGTATITTKTTTLKPVTVTEVKNGTVMQASGSSIIVRTDQGFKSFTQGDIDKRGIKILREGKPAEISDFHSGDQLSATIVTTRAPRVLTEKQVNATLARSGGTAGSAESLAGAASSSATTGSPSASATAGTSASSQRAAGTSGGGAAGGRKLPKTASQLPLLGLTGVALLLLGAALRTRRRNMAD